MPEKVTPQRMHEVFVQVNQQSPAESRLFYGHVSPDWDKLTEEQRRIFANMALKFNAIVGEFEVEDK